MATHRTVMFADLTDSSALFESIGNTRAASWLQLVTNTVAHLGQQHGALLTKLLGDGVLMLFPDGLSALHAAEDIQRGFAQMLASVPASNKPTQLKIGIASGPVVEVEGDCYGDAVNLAARLCDMAGGSAIWATRDVTSALPRHEYIRYRDLGSMRIRGFSEPRAVLQIEWDETQTSDLMTVRGSIGAQESSNTMASIELRWLDIDIGFGPGQMPIRLGRAPDCEFTIADPRVSRVHAQIGFGNGSFRLTDLSTYGTWVRFDDAQSDIALRRGDCVLLGSGQIAFGAPFTDFSVPTASFMVREGVREPVA